MELSTADVEKNQNRKSILLIFFNIILIFSIPPILKKINPAKPIFWGYQYFFGIDFFQYLDPQGHVEHKMDHQFDRKMVRFWKCSAVTLHESKAYAMGDHEQDPDQTYHQWTKMQNLPGWWIKKVWHSYDGWLLVAKKDEFSLLVTEAPRQVDQRNLVEETIGSENRNESQRQNQAATMSKNALQQCLHLADDALLRARPRSPRGARGEAAARALPPQDQDEEAAMPQALWGNWVWHSPDTSSLKLRCLQHRVFQSPALAWLVTSEISA